MGGGPSRVYTCSLLYYPFCREKGSCPSFVRNISVRGRNVPITRQSIVTDVFRTVFKYRRLVLDSWFFVKGETLVLGVSVRCFLSSGSPDTILVFSRMSFTVSSDWWSPIDPRVYRVVYDRVSPLLRTPGLPSYKTSRLQSDLFTWGIWTTKRNRVGLLGSTDWDIPETLKVSSKVLFLPSPSFTT